MILEDRKRYVVQLVGEGKSAVEIAKIINISTTMVYNWYNQYAGLIKLEESERNNKDHIIHLEIVPAIYHVLTRAGIYSINELKRRIKDQSIYRIRSVGNKYVDILRRAILKYEDHVEIEILISTIYKEFQFHKFHIILFDIEMDGIYEYNNNTKEEKLYIDSEYDMKSIEDIVIKEIKKKEEVHI